MAKHHRIIRFPLITEKNTNLRVNENKYVFEVAKHAKKPEIRRAVESIFNVKVEKVNTMNMDGKLKRVRRNAGRTPDWKKAIVKLEKGQSIGKFEGV